MTIELLTGGDVIPDRVVDRLRGHLTGIYGDEAGGATLLRLVEVLQSFQRDHPHAARPRALFDETDVILIAYGDQVREPDHPPLRSLRRFLNAHIGGAVSGLHLLPHYPWTSDDGFAVVDYTAVDPSLGEWRHVEELAGDFRLMLDAIANHTSASNEWFVRWRCGNPDYADFYIAVDPATDLRSVTRPRTSPLLTPVWSRDEDPQWVWTTFSADQVDLNYANPNVLLAITEVLLGYIARGAGLLRLDAVGFLWKRLGTSCLHLPETHEIIRLWRTIVDAVAPGTLLVTETNVPHEENISYFGDGSDEAHLVYQFALPPLALATFHAGDATPLREWARTLQDPGPQATFLNFLASHDGIGLRPVEGLLTADEIAKLSAAVQARGGRVSYRSRGDGTTSPYELNSVYFDALVSATEDVSPSRQIDRFVSAHAILLTLAGVPAIYFHSLFGSRNWPEGADHAGRARVINRQRFSRSVLEAQLADPESVRHAVLNRVRSLIAARIREPAFHPSADQKVFDAGASYFAVQRTRTRGDGTVVCVHDVSGRPGRLRAVPPDRFPGGAQVVDLLDGSQHVTEADGTFDVAMPPYGVRWLHTS